VESRKNFIGFFALLRLSSRSRGKFLFVNPSVAIEFLLFPIENVLLCMLKENFRKFVKFFEFKMMFGAGMEHNVP
jgi:hypothetical protein